MDTLISTDTTVPPMMQYASTLWVDLSANVKKDTSSSIEMAFLPHVKVCGIACVLLCNDYHSYVHRY